MIGSCIACLFIIHSILFRDRGSRNSLIKLMLMMMKVIKMKKFMGKGIGMWKITKQRAHRKKCIIVYIIISHDISKFLVKFMWSPLEVH